ncbi:MAG TPA: lysozyme inhibitor LprI family protein [Methyloceanibacter sp.]|jgi:uncharacterized protein YecT (DUF1311 family)|nr:lysozyme inhibitor LprI family protein [Methyloceanibacter sp.]
MRLRSLLTLAMMLSAAPAFATDISAVCYDECEASTHSNPDYKACVARAADKADAALNDSYRKLRDAIRSVAGEMGQAPDAQLAALKDTQKSWVAYRDTNCAFEDSLAFGGTAIGGNYSSSFARSPTNALTISSASRSRSWAWNRPDIRPSSRLKPRKNLVY